MGFALARNPMSTWATEERRDERRKGRGVCVYACVCIQNLPDKIQLKVYLVFLGILVLKFLF